MTEKTKTESNYDKIKKLRELHQPVFDTLGVPGALYFPKMFYRPQGEGELHVSFFKSELQRGQDIYTEMVDRDFVSEDSSRRLYHWKYNPQWAEDYEPTDTMPIRYLIPVSELSIVSKGNEALKELTEAFPDEHIKEDTSDCITGDCSIDEMSMKDLYCMIQNVPKSSKQWLNKLILENGGKK